MQTGSQRAGISVGDFGYDGERLLLKIMLLYDEFSWNVELSPKTCLPKRM